jgi:hypothetical protein
LHTVQEDLALEIAGEDMLFPLREITEILGISQDVYFFGSPEKSQLFVSEFVKLSILQGIIPLHTHSALGVQER